MLSLEIKEPEVFHALLSGFILSVGETRSYRTADKKALSPAAITLDPEDRLEKGTFPGQEVRFLATDSESFIRDLLDKN